MWNSTCLDGPQRRTAAILTVLILSAAPAAAQLSTSTTTSPTPPPPGAAQTDLVEWDVSNFGDLVSGALAVDDKSSSRNSKVWFVTRAAGVRLYRLTPALNMKKDSSSAKSWDLNALLTGGARLRHSDDGRFAFVNVTLNTGQDALVAVDTKDDTRTTWADRPTSSGQLSDVSVDTRGGAYTVFTAAPIYDSSDFLSPPNGVVQQLRPAQPQLVNGSWVVPATVTRYPVGGGAGTCVDTIGGAGSPCIPGVTVDRRRGAPIFVSEPTFEFKDSWGNTVSVGAIGEIDPKPVKCPTNPLCTCVRVRHWPLPAGITGPRQLRVDDMGRLWGITTDGHLFSLDIDRHCDQAKLTRHDPLGPGDEDLFAVAPNDGIIGFTDSNNNKVSVLFPQRVTTTVSPAVTFIQPVTKTISGKKECADPQPSTVTPRVSTALGVSYTNPGDGSYVETDISTGMSGSTTPSMFPTGMAPDGTWKTGAFFYGVTLSDPTGKTNRIGHFAIKIDKHKEVECRRGDDDDDHDGIDNEHDDDLDGDGIPNSLDDDDDNDGTPDVLDDDKNGDGIEDKYQSRGSRETKRSDNGQMAPGEAKEYDMEYDEHSVLMLAVVEAADLTTPLAIDIVDPNGVVVLSTPPAVGKAVATATPALPGVYTVRVRNAGLTPVTYKTTLVGRQIQY